MKTGGAWTSGKTFFAMIITAGLVLTAGAAAAQGMQEAMNAIQRCGCNDPSGIKLYVDNVMNDARQRGMTAETAKIHSTACFAVWCVSFCSGPVGAVERCFTAASAYFDTASGLNARLYEDPRNLLTHAKGF